MDWKKRFDDFDFHDEIATYKQIDPIAAIEQEIFVTNRQRQLHLKRNARVRELTSQALPVGRFEQARSEVAMNLDCASNHLLRQLIKFHLRVLRALRGGEGYTRLSLLRTERQDGFAVQFVEDLREA